MIRSHFIGFLLLFTTAGLACVVQERRVELHGSTPTTPTPVGSHKQPTIAASPVEEGAGVAVSKLDDATLRRMIEKASASEKFVVRVSDIRRGRALAAGRAEPLVERAPTKQ